MIILQSNNCCLFCSLTQLRLLYEGNPMAYIMENAGGLASNGSIPILDVQPTSLHERVPVFLGSRDDVQDMIDAYKALN